MRFGKEKQDDRRDLEMDEGQTISFQDLVAYGYGNEMQGFGNPIYDEPVQVRSSLPFGELLYKHLYIFKNAFSSKYWINCEVT